MEKEKNFTIKEIILISLIIFICMISLYFGWKIIKFLFWEEDTNKSPLDESFVIADAGIVLKSTDLSKIQSEILTYISEWVKVCDLLYVNAYLDSDLELRSVVFVYRLDVIDNYIGRLEVKCTNENEDENWEIVRAESIYYYDENQLQNGNENGLVDSLLSQKIQAVVDYIELRGEQRVNLYLLSINGNNVHINAHNMENEDTKNNWQEYCIIYQNENGLYIESKDTD